MNLVKNIFQESEDKQVETVSVASEFESEEE